MIVGHETKEHKMIPDFITVAASESKLAARLLEILKRVFT